MKHQLWQAFRLLHRSPAFARFWIGRLISLFGDAFTLIALSAVACLLVGLSGLVTPAFRGLSLPPVELES